MGEVSSEGDRRSRKRAHGSGGGGSSDRAAIIPRLCRAPVSMSARRSLTGTGRGKEIADRQAPAVSDPALRQMVRPIVQHVAALIIADVKGTGQGIDAQGKRPTDRSGRTRAIYARFLSAARKKLVRDLATVSAQRRVVWHEFRGWARRRWADWRSLGGVGEEPDISLIAELGELGEETVDLGLRRALVEMVLSKIPELRTVLEHMIDRGQQRCGDRAESFRRAATALEALELRPEIAVLSLLADTAHWTSVVFSQGAPFRNFEDLRLPALSFWPGHSPAQATTAHTHLAICAN